MQAILYRDIWECYQIAYSDILNDLQNMYTMYFFAVIVFFVFSCSNLIMLIIFFWLCSYYGHWKLSWVKSSHEKKSHGLATFMKEIQHEHAPLFQISQISILFSAQDLVPWLCHDPYQWHHSFSSTPSFMQ